MGQEQNQPFNNPFTAAFGGPGQQQAPGQVPQQAPGPDMNSLFSSFAGWAQQQGFSAGQAGGAISEADYRRLSLAALGHLPYISNALHASGQALGQINTSLQELKEAVEDRSIGWWDVARAAMTAGITLAGGRLIDSYFPMGKK